MKKKDLILIPQPQEAIEFLNSEIIGQEDAKKTLSTIVFENINNEYNINEPKTTQILFTGHENTGKKRLIEKISEFYNIPLININLFNWDDQLTIKQFFNNEIYNGCLEPDEENITEEPTVEKSNENIETTETDNEDEEIKFKSIENYELSLVYVEGFDLIVDKNYWSSYGSVDTVSKRINQTVIKQYLEDRTPIIGNVKEIGIIDISKMIFIFGGQFGKLEDIISNRITGEKVIGFKPYNQYPYQNEFNKRKVFEYATKDDFLEFGFNPELFESFSNITYTTNFTENEISEILKKKIHILT